MKKLRQAKSFGTGTARAAGGNPFGLLRTASRWVVEHTGLVTLVTVLMVTSLCIGAWRLSYRHAQVWDSLHPGQPVPFRLLAIAGWMLVIGVGIWYGLWRLSIQENEAPSISDDADWWRFDRRHRQRIFEGRAMSRLWLHALFGLLGFALGLALALRLAAAAAWQEPLLSGEDLAIWLVVPAIIVMAVAARRIRDVLFLHYTDSFVGDDARKLAQTIAEQLQAEADADREYQRKDITGWPFLILIGGFVGGLFLANRWLPPADGNVASQASVSGLVASVAALYLLKTKPRGWLIWLGVAFAVAVGLLVFTQLSWHRSPIYLLLGTLWGAGVGVAAMLLYLRDLRGN